MSSRTRTGRLALFAAVACTLASVEGKATTFKQVHSGLTSVTPIQRTPVTVWANDTVRLETFDLSAGSDTVLHVQNAYGAHEPFVAGNDDCAPPARHSCVTLPPSSSTRDLVVYIRSYGLSAGTGRLRMVRNGVTWWETAPFTFGGKQIYSTFNAGSQVATTLIQKQLSDSVVLLTSSTAVAVAADDDDGAGRASNLRSPSAFSGSIIVGSYNGADPGSNAAITVIQDDDLATADPDGDGLGTTLENLLTTNPNLADTDDDGISDGREVLGESSIYQPELQLPTWGADPKVKDLFVEVDWDECPLSNPGCGGNINLNQFTVDEVTPVVHAFWGPTSGTLQPASDARVAVHMDIGRANPAAAGSASLTQWGDWGGGRMVSAGSPLCWNLNGARVGVFHLAEVTGYASAGEGDWCALVAKDGRTPAHELGHNMFMGSHGGMRGSGSGNYKAVYPSLMNYSYSYHPGVTHFSVASYQGVNFNPTAVSETNWKASAPHADPNLLQYLGYTVSGNTVDWNMDGVPGGTVKAAINWEGSSGTFRDNGYHEGGLGPNVRDPAMTWYRTLVGNRFYMFYVARDTKQVRYRYIANLQSSCGASITDPALIDLPTPPCANWGIGDLTVPNGVLSSAGVAVVEFSQNGLWKLMLVYVDEAFRLKFTVLSAGEFSQWTTPAVVDAGYNGSSGVTAVYNPVTAAVEIFANVPTAGGGDPQVKSWSFNASTSTWSAGALQQYTNGQPILTKADVGVTMGYTKGNGTPAYFMVVPRGLNEYLPVARRTAANQWELLNTDLTAHSDVRPGIAYVPFSTTDITNGRLMILSRDYWQGIYRNGPTISFSEGNDLAGGATSQRLSTWRSALYYIQEDVADPLGMALYHNTQLDTNVRGAMSIYGTIWFQPYADGIVPYQTGFKDQNDYDMMKKNLKCSLVGGCKTCLSLNSNGTCASWTP